MQTAITVTILVDHDGNLSHSEIAATVGCWVDHQIGGHYVIETETDDRVPAQLTLVAAPSAT